MGSCQAFGFNWRREIRMIYLICFIWVVGWMATTGFIDAKVTKAANENPAANDLKEIANYKKNKIGVVVVFFFI